MRLALQAHLLVDADRAAQLSADVARFNEACRWLAGEAVSRRHGDPAVWKKRSVRKARERFGLPPRMAILAVRRVREACGREKGTPPVFRPDAAIPCDARSLRSGGEASASLLTLDGRIPVRVVPGDAWRERLNPERKLAYLLRCKDGTWILLIGNLGIPSPEVSPALRDRGLLCY